MAKEKFIEKRFNAKSLQRIVLCDQIIKRYQAQRLKLTLRQLYYQLVTTNAIPNEEKSYKHLSYLISDARLAGLLDWDAIEDRIRQPRTQADWENLGELVEGALAAYRLPRWKNQDNYIELWIEKDALAGVLQPIAREYHVTMMVNRGYSSQSAMYEAAQRFGEAIGNGQHGILFYLGDLDPSGEDMVRDIASRFETFGVDVDVHKLALTIEQVNQYNPPPNPAKQTDPRSDKYIDKFGSSSWEVDALNPVILQTLVRGAIDDVRDSNLLDEVLNQEERDKERLREALINLDSEE